MESVTDQFTIEIEERVVVEASMDAAFEALLHRMGPGNKGGGETPMPMVMETHPGGRWYRDLGNGAGHLWGHVQSYRPPDLLEIYGPLFMSLPVSNNLIVRLSEVEGGTEIVLRHTAHGPVPSEHVAGMTEGWKGWLADVRSDCSAGG